MKCWAIVPVKRLAAAKSRLAPALPARRRRELVAFLLKRTLDVLQSDPGVKGIIVVGRDRAVSALARRNGASFVGEGQRGGLNRALTRARTAAVRHGAEAVMVVPADLPMLSAEDIARVRRKAGRPPFVVVGPDRSGEGTNVLYLAPPGVIGFCFGEGSCRRHIRAARQAGVQAAVLRRKALAQDLDRPEDLRCLEGFSSPAMDGKNKT
jgi:2-phospho-L-lactate guanylyltransferase